MTELAAVLVRWLHLVAATTLVGVFAFLVGVARPASRETGPADAEALAALDTRLVRVARWALGAVLAAGLLDLWRQAAVASGEGPLASLTWPTVAAVLGDTRYGTVWLARHGLLVLLAALVLARDVERDAADWLAFRLEAGVLAAAGLVLVGAAGHAAAIDDAEPLLPLSLDGVHLLATGLWLGALGPFALFLRWLDTRPERTALRVAAVAARRFSALGLTAVLLLAASGTYNAWQQVAGFAPLLGTPYGHWLLVKLALFAGLVGVAAVNLLRVKPRLAAAAAEAPAAAGRPLLRRLRRQVLAEALLGVLVLAAVAVLGLTTPARHDPVDWPLPARFDWEVTRDLPGVRTRVAVGSQLALLGLVAALLAGIVRRPRWGWVVAGGLGAIGLGLGVALPPLSVDAYPTTYLRPAVGYTATSVARGAELYGAHCASCHGAAGYGDGPAAASLRPSPPDLTARHTGDHTAGDIFWWLTHGVPGSAMPAFGERLTAEERWDLVNLVRTLGAAEAARGLGPAATPDPAIVAPDFVYTAGIGEAWSLRDHRGRASVLLVFFSLPHSFDRLLRLAELYPEIKGRRADVLAVPLDGGPDVYRRLGPRPVFFPIAIEGAAEATAAYRLFGRDVGQAGALAAEVPPRHLELLVDRQGYLRARWVPPAPGWGDGRRLLGELDRLAAESPRGPAPEEHIH